MNPASAARTVISSAGSALTRVPVLVVTWANWSVTEPSIASTGAGEVTGAPFGGPVSAIAPDAAQSSTAHGSNMPHYRPRISVVAPAGRVPCRMVRFFIGGNLTKNFCTRESRPCYQPPKPSLMSV